MKYKLRNFVEAVSETEPSPQNSQFDRFVGLEHYDSGEIEITRYTDTSLLSSSVKIFRANDILIARRNVYLKRAGIVFFDGLTSGDSIILRVLKDCERGTGVPYSDALRWLPLILNSSAFWAYANKHADGMNSKRISKEMLLDYEFGAPSIETIRSIADKVWSAHSLKKRYRKLLDLTDEMVKSRFIEMFGSLENTKPLSECIGITFPGEWGEDDSDGTGVNVIRTTNFTNSGKLDLTNVVTRKIDQAKIDKKHLIPGDIILERSGGTADNPVGRVVYFEAIGTFLSNNFTQLLRCKDGVNSLFVFYSLYNYYHTHKSEIRSMGNKTTGIQNLKMDKYWDIPIADASPELQDQFMCLYKQADKSTFELKQAIEKIDKVMRALLQ